MSVKPIFFALDGKSIDEFEFELKRLKGHIYGVKIGLELFISEGPSVVERLKNQGWKSYIWENTFNNNEESYVKTYIKFFPFKIGIVWIPGGIIGKTENIDTLKNKLVKRRKGKF